ncbi:MAG: hypothetical protein IPL96_15920 [Holophagaceae bacterium]|nr:hypothetical protein [Holophagaceae bacterium]
MLYAPLEHLIPLSVPLLLKELKELRRRDGAQGTPWTTFVLRSGREIRGRLIEVGASEGREIAVVQLPDVGHEASRDAAYLEVAEIVALLVEEARVLVPAPEHEAGKGAGEAAGPNLVQLTEKAADFGRRISAAAGQEIPCRLLSEGQTMSPEILRAMAQVIEDTSAVLEQLAKDRFSRTVIQRNLKEVHVGLAHQVDAVLVDGILRIAGQRDVTPQHRRAVSDAIRRAL